MLWSRSGGSDDGPLLVLLHGLGATADVWLGVEALLDDAWDGGWLSVDLPGHGRSPWDTAYSFEEHAAAVAALLPQDRELVLMGHSMGGMVALALAAVRPRTTRVIAFSVKTWWPPTHVEHMRRQAAREPVVFERREIAAGLYVKLAGLARLVQPADVSVTAGVAQVEGGWRLAQDPATFDFGVPDMPTLLARLDCPVTLARGSEDHLVRPANVSDLVDDPVTLDGLGHNPHVEDPAAVVALLPR